MRATGLDNSPDLRLVRAVVDDYFQGLYHGDIEKLRGAFHQNARIVGYREGVYTDLARDQWLERVSSRPVPAKQGERFEMSIESIDLKGAVGVVKVRDFYTGLQFTDYLSVTKIDGRWHIMNKVFHHD
jgi:hypothetical protein